MRGNRISEPIFSIFVFSFIIAIHNPTTNHRAPIRNKWIKTIIYDAYNGIFTALDYIIYIYVKTFAEYPFFKTYLSYKNLKTT